MAVAAAAMVGFPQAYLEGKEVKETSSLVTELCRHFYTQGWVSGTGGSITMKVHDASIPKPEQLIVMSPSGSLHLKVAFFLLDSNFVTSLNSCLCSIELMGLFSWTFNLLFELCV